MEYKEVEKPAMKFVGIGVNSTVQTASQDCPIVWEKFISRAKEVKNVVNEKEMFGPCTTTSIEDCTFRYLAAYEVSEFVEIPEGMEKLEIPAAKYWIFTHTGKLDKLGQTYGEIMEFMKEKGVKEGKIWVEAYDERYKHGEEDSEFDLWCSIEE